MKPKRSIGQHFLLDLSVVDVMCDAAHLSQADTVIEIGAGHGTLTHELAKRAGRVLAIEMDDECMPLLTGFFGEQKNVELVHADALAWWDKAHQQFHDRDYKLVANLPYNIASHVLRIFLEQSPRPSQMVVMVQKEVAERAAAPPGKMSMLSLAVQYYGDAKIIALVPQEAFDPPPAVTSAVLSIKTKRCVDGREAKRIFHLARLGFASRRKQLHALLAKPLGKTNGEIKKVIESIGAPATARAQELSITQWKQLAESLS
jgi:16S rRNA (adenine1518-N6/adenine1519-N6)-dimethyltransferase